MKILVRAPNWVGDQILAYPFFYYLRRAYPEAQITSVCVPWVASLQFRDLVDVVHVMSVPRIPSWFSKFSMLERESADLRSRSSWDLAFSLPDSFSAAWLLYRSKARRRIGYQEDGRGFLLTDCLEGQSSVHRAQAYLNLLPREKRPNIQAKEFWGIPAETEHDSEIPAVTHFEPELSWRDIEPILPPKEPYWVLAPGSMASSRKWPEERFATLARVIVEQFGIPGVIVGGTAEADFAARVSKQIQLKDRTAQGSVASHWKIFRHAQFTVSNDSGLAHVAALCGSRVCSIWGAGDPKRTSPLGPGKVRVLLNPVECWPCERNSCLWTDERRLLCLKGIQPDTVAMEIQNAFLRQTEFTRT